MPTIPYDSLQPSPFEDDEYAIPAGRLLDIIGGTEMPERIRVIDGLVDAGLTIDFDLTTTWVTNGETVYIYRSDFYDLTIRVVP